MAALQDRVWGLHEFVAENPDEVSFNVGEVVMIVERDDQYGDGWWQGTNEKGETGLFPFSYTTLDRDLAMSAKALAMSAGGDGSENQQTDSGQQQQQPGMMTTTMADLDKALTELQGDTGASIDGGSISGQADRNVRQSFQSERTADLSIDEHTDGGGEDEYQSRANARAALAANAKANAASQLEKERAEQERMRSQAQRLFEEEEARHRELLLRKEEERKQAAAKGELDLTKDASTKIAPIEGVDMSDESDSEGSVTGLDAYPAAATTHSPLFGNQDRPTFAAPFAVPSQQQSDAEQDRKPADVPTFTSPFIASAETASKEQSVEAKKEAENISQVQQKSEDPLGSGARRISEYEAPPYPQKPITDNAASNASVARSSVVPPAAYEAPPHSMGPASSNDTSHTGTSLPQKGDATPNANPASQSKGTLAESQPAITESGINQTASENSAVPPAFTPSPFETGSAIGTGSGTHTAATSVTGGRDTPKSFAKAAVPSAGSPAPSFAASRPPLPPGDPHDWTVEQVVEWARSKGWDENSVVSKFQEHEISGDVLLEMDINILKEIDISAFGKRFQVANAIKELKGGKAGGSSQIAPSSGYPYAPSSANSIRTPSEVHIRQSQDSQPTGPAPLITAVAGGHGTYGGWGNGDMGNIGLGPPPALDPPAPIDAVGSMRNVSFDRNVSFGNGSGMNTYDSIRSPTPRSRDITSNSIGASSIGGSADPQPPGAFSSPGGPRKKTLSELADEALIKRSVSSTVGQSPTTSGFSDIGSAGSPSRKRDSGPRQPGSGERASFFAGINQRIRRGAPGSHSTGTASEDEPRKTSRSKTGFSKSAKTTSNSDIKNQISLPTTSPTFDSAGDTARRGGLHLNGVGSASGGPGSGHDGNISASTVEEGDGPVMARIKPVDLEGWMKKKGERYNSWKPRYLALKGSDLVILRDPTAPKIKGYVSMKGYKVIADENTNPGKYGFKILHETEKPHYFSSDDPVLVREWMKALMKATIGRDHSFPVISSYNNATISLAEAQRMNPPPRPPSPLSRARTQKAKMRENTTELTAKDAAVLSSISSAVSPLGYGNKGM